MPLIDRDSVLRDFNERPQEFTWLFRALLLCGQDASTKRELFSSLTTVQSMFASVAEDQRVLLSLEELKDELGVGSELRAEIDGRLPAQLLEIRSRLADASLPESERERLKQEAVDMFMKGQGEEGLRALRGLLDSTSKVDEERHHEAILTLLRK